MMEQLNRYTTTQNLPSDYISAYRPNFSTETVLVKFDHDMLKVFGEQKGLLLTGLDLSVAFDTDTVVLANMHGIDGVMLQWFRDYLRNELV